MFGAKSNTLAAPSLLWSGCSECASDTSCITLSSFSAGNVPPLEANSPEETPEETAYRETSEIIYSLIEKQSLINLVLAYAVSLKHYCRAEYGVYYEDLFPLISFLPKHCYNSDDSMTPELLPLWQTYHQVSS